MSGSICSLMAIEESIRLRYLSATRALEGESRWPFSFDRHPVSIVATSVWARATKRSMSLVPPFS